MEQNIPNTSPFLDPRFMDALERSGSIGSLTGWEKVEFKYPTETSTLFSFIKNHSYGEYIFDWQWANAFSQYGLDYYPKLTSMIPFTPVTTSHFKTEDDSESTKNHLMDLYEKFYQSANFSSSHFLFLTEEEVLFFKNRDYTIRESFQYHFFNDGYKSFDDFLQSLKGKKSKQIRKERFFPDLKIKRLTGGELQSAHADEVYNFYHSTIDLKQGIAYLKKDFFKIVFETMKDNILYVQASRDGKAIAGAFYFFDNNRLYGRYCGTHIESPNLHFELCYYQGIDFAIERKLEVFEAGAQGEHKIARGFKPVRTYSAHKIKHPAFSEAIKKIIEDEKIQIDKIIIELSKGLPFKSNS